MVALTDTDTGTDMDTDMDMAIHMTLSNGVEKQAMAVSFTKTELVVMASIDTGLSARTGRPPSVRDPEIPELGGTMVITSIAD